MSAVALVSLVCTGGATATLAIARVVVPERLPDPRLLIADTRDYLSGPAGPHHLRLVSLAAVVEVALSILLAYLLYRLGPKKWRVGVSVSLSALSYTFREGPPGSGPLVRVLT